MTPFLWPVPMTLLLVLFGFHSLSLPQFELCVVPAALMIMILSGELKSARHHGAFLHFQIYSNILFSNILFQIYYFPDTGIIAIL